jgi:hypothetical protein
MKVLIACEESQEVCKAFRAKGHEAYSCDIQECSGGHPEWHIMGDVLPLLNGRCRFQTMDGVWYEIDGKWDLIIAHPPCTYLSNAGSTWLFPQKGMICRERLEKGMDAKEFFMSFYNADCEKIVIENPVPCGVYRLPKYDQIIQHYEHGHPYSKKTCLWLKGVEKLKPTKVITDGIISWVSSGSSCRNQKRSVGFSDAKTRSKTFTGIAKAMAEQWG